jgi:protein TonB
MKRFILRLFISLSAMRLLFPEFSGAAETRRDGVIPGSSILKMVKPEYPLAARQRHLTGSGLLILHVDRHSGEVTSITIHKSTGHAILDAAAMRAFIQWRFKPGSAKDVKMPVSYTMERI